MRSWFAPKIKDTQAPADPFLIGRQGFGAPLHYSFGFRQPPLQGAGNYAFETLALPRYDKSGPSFGTRESWQYHQAVVGVLQGVNLTAIGSPGLMTGTFYAAPLTDNTPSNIDPATLAALNMRSSFKLPRL